MIRISPRFIFTFLTFFAIILLASYLFDEWEEPFRFGNREFWKKAGLSASFALVITLLQFWASRSMKER